MNEKPEPSPEADPSDDDASPEEQFEVIQAEEFFRGRRKIGIDLNGVRYRLELTRRHGFGKRNRCDSAAPLYG